MDGTSPKMSPVETNQTCLPWAPGHLGLDKAPTISAAVPGFPRARVAITTHRATRHWGMHSQQGVEVELQLQPRHVAVRAHLTRAFREPTSPAAAVVRAPAATKTAIFAVIQATADHSASILRLYRRAWHRAAALTAQQLSLSTVLQHPSPLGLLVDPPAAFWRST